MKILKDRYSRSTDHVLASMYQQLTIDESDLPTGVSSRNCGCNKSSCSCCVHLTLEKVFQDDTGCVHVSYLRSENGFEFKATLNGGNLIDSKDIVSEVGKTSPPFCVTIPSERRPVRMCVIFRDLHLSDLEMFGCASFSVLLASLDVGCFRFSSSTQRQSEVDSGNFSSFIAPGDTGDINFLDIS
ncbi:cholecystokinin receptor type a-like [Plakobranchus ocellatus]|uniref:Cholecystokinin receptor type a-like n=1 Tax=Plakobranchus ocellatus TaxID=259542 RepID=A0AAV4BCP4_9GAST|nr:cholecystokinin receptor type a-like [Plakobranchus ocellatus]